MAIHDLKRSIRSTQPGRPSFPLSAVQHVRRMAGSNQAHLMRASDGRFYVTKFQNNPCHPRVLANELLAARLGLWLGLPMPHIAVIEVSGWLIAHTQALHIEIAESRIPCSSGLQLASRYVADPARDQVFDYLPRSEFRKVVNRQDLIRVLAFDKWVGNCDSRQAVFTKRAGQSQFEMTLIDHGSCFNAGQWTFPDLPSMGTYPHPQIYRNVTGWDSFEPVLSLIEEIDYINLWKFAAEVPQEWYQYDATALCRLVDMLYKRRLLIRDFITSFRFSTVNPFPQWSVKGLRRFHRLLVLLCYRLDSGANLAGVEHRMGISLMAMKANQSKSNQQQERLEMYLNLIARSPDTPNRVIPLQSYTQGLCSP